MTGSGIDAYGHVLVVDSRDILDQTEVLPGDMLRSEKQSLANVDDAAKSQGSLPHVCDQVALVRLPACMATPWRTCRTMRIRRIALCLSIKWTFQSLVSSSTGLLMSAHIP
jgi:hypothetical protein